MEIARFARALLKNVVEIKSAEILRRAARWTKKRNDNKVIKKAAMTMVSISSWRSETAKVPAINTFKRFCIDWLAKYWKRKANERIIAMVKSESFQIVVAKPPVKGKVIKKEVKKDMHLSLLTDSGISTFSILKIEKFKSTNCIKAVRAMY
jgi:hypothetical protein